MGMGLTPLQHSLKQAKSLVLLHSNVKRYGHRTCIVHVLVEAAKSLAPFRSNVKEHGEVPYQKP